MRIILMGRRIIAKQIIKMLEKSRRENNNKKKKYQWLMKVKRNNRNINK